MSGRWWVWNSVDGRPLRLHWKAEVKGDLPAPSACGLRGMFMWVKPRDLHDGAPKCKTCARILATRGDSR